MKRLKLRQYTGRKIILPRQMIFRGFEKNENGTEVITIGGKEITGDWRYGNYLWLDYESDRFIIPFTSNDYTEEEYRGVLRTLDIYKVIPETVCQCSPLKIKNKNKLIFQNDLLELELYDDRIKYKGIVTVEFDERMGTWKFVSINNKKHFLTLQDIDNIHFFLNIKVIGNIFDTEVK